MIELRLLGPVELNGLVEEDAAIAVLRQPKRLALLAFLCLAGRIGAVRRDLVLAAFWPELDETRARAALRQALHFLRQQLGDELLATRGDELAVSGELVRTDVAAFDAAIAEERWSDAAALYRGPLLEGFHPAGVGEAFEEWLGRERARLHDGARLAVDELARAAEANSDAWCAVRWARRAVELEPLHEARTRRLMRLLDTAGDPAGAVGAYEALERRLREERDAMPSAATMAVAMECRRTAADAESMPAPAAAASAPPVETTSAPPLDAEVAQDATANASPAVERPHRRRIPTALAAAAFAAMLALAAGLGWWSSRADAGSPEGDAPIRLVVLPFEEVGTQDDDFLLAGMTEAIANRLASLGRLQVVDPQSAARYQGIGLSAQAIGEELDAAYVLRATIRRRRGADGAQAAEVIPMLVRTSDGTVRWTGAPYLVTVRDVFDVQTEIAGDVATALDVTLTREERRQLARPPAAHPQAYRDYVAGLALLREYRAPRQMAALDSATALLTRATERDTAFAPAFARLAEARLQRYMSFVYPAEPDPRELELFHEALDRARRLDPDLPEAIALHGHYLVRVVRDTAAAFEAFDRASALRPSDAELLANRIRYPHSMGALEHDAALLERALRLDPRSPRAIQNMMMVMGMLRDYAAEDHFALRLIEVDSLSFVGYLHAAHAALLARGDTTYAQAVLMDGVRRAAAPMFLLKEFHMLGDGFARAFDTLTVEKLVRSPIPNGGDSLFFLQAQFEAAVRVGEPGRLRRVAAAYQRYISRRPGPQVQAVPIAYIKAALGHRREAERDARLSEEHMAGQLRMQFAGGDTIEARRNAAGSEYALARVYALTENLPKMTQKLRRALTAPHGPTPRYVRLDPAFRRWLGHPEFERLLDELENAR